MTTPVVAHRASFPLPATPERAFRALVEPDQLARWFAETVRVELAPGGAFAFSGRGAFGAPASPSADPVPQTITAYEPGRALAFTWAIHGVESQVRWTVTADENDAGASRFAVEHDVLGALPVKNAKHVIDDLWRLHAGNLMAHLAGGDNVVLADFASDKPEVRLSIEIDAPPKKVFRALLVPELMNRWLGGAAKVDVEQRAYSYGWRYDCEGRSVDGGPTSILELVEDERLVTDWTDWRGDATKPSTRITWSLEPLAGGSRTRLTIVHDGFEQPVDRSDYQQGWGAFAGELAKVAPTA